jgi:NAD(P)-dependent dehydrogenase (short-subunit alcohol dehydrogenase family)
VDALVCNAGALLTERTLTSEGLEVGLRWRDWGAPLLAALPTPSPVQTGQTPTHSLTADNDPAHDHPPTPPPAHPTPQVTFATHLLVGSYYLTTLALPLLLKASEPRVVLVSSGGMYNCRFPGVQAASAQTLPRPAASASDPAAEPTPAFNGQLAYAYAKRGQVILGEQLARVHPRVGFFSCHPGWTATPGVDSAYGSQQKWLEPMRSLWEGAEGILWLCLAPLTKLESGAFYLDRAVQRKHLPSPSIGALFHRGEGGEGSYTENTEAEIADMMAQLEAAATARA